MKNTFITNYQRMMRKNTFIDTTDNLHYINSSENSTNNEAYSSFAMDDITTAIESLESAYKVPFMMHFRGFKYHEIAAKLEIPIGTVKNRIHIARKELKHLLSVYSHLDLSLIHILILPTSLGNASEVPVERIRNRKPTIK